MRAAAVGRGLAIAGAGPKISRPKLQIGLENGASLGGPRREAVGRAALGR